jgi:predicted lipoprotein with Yx(FWY)xxD motif
MGGNERTPRIICSLCLLAAIAVVIAGCGGGGSTSSSSADGAQGESDSSRKELTPVAGGPEPESGVVGVLRVGKVGALGSVVIDRGLHTVYVFDKDSGSTSSCYDACAAKWPPMITQAGPIARDGIDVAKLGTIEREDGSMQVTYAGQPLYDYLGDTAAAEANGNGIEAFGGKWSVIRPNGEALTSPAKGAWGVVFGAEGEEVGLILYDLSGHTLYTFDSDKGTTSTCYGACAKAWPPALTEGKARAEGEASPALVGTTKRRDGTIQMTYAGHPLYTHLGDEQAEVNGAGRGVHAFGGRWYAIRPNGQRP